MGKIMEIKKVIIFEGESDSLRFNEFTDALITKIYKSFNICDPVEMKEDFGNKLSISKNCLEAKRKNKLSLFLPILTEKEIESLYSKTIEKFPEDQREDVLNAIIKAYNYKE